MARNLSVRLSDDHERALEALTNSVRATYESQGVEAVVTDSSALRALLMAWFQNSPDRFPKRPLGA